jgi:hypothetical protein
MAANQWLASGQRSAGAAAREAEERIALPRLFRACGRAKGSLVERGAAQVSSSL